VLRLHHSTETYLIVTHPALSSASMATVCPITGPITSLTHLTHTHAPAHPIAIDHAHPALSSASMAAVHLTAGWNASLNLHYDSLTPDHMIPDPLNCSIAVVTHVAPDLHMCTHCLTHSCRGSVAALCPISCMSIVAT